MLPVAFIILYMLIMYSVMFNGYIEWTYHGLFYQSPLVEHLSLV